MSKKPIKEPKDCNPPFEWANLATELVKELKKLAKCKCNGKETCPICLGTGYISYDELMKKIFMNENSKTEYIPNIVSNASNCILIGEGLFTDKDYHLLVDTNGIKINKIMSKDEYELIKDILVAAGNIK